MIDSVTPSISPVGPSSAAAADLARAAAGAASPEAASADFGAMLGQLTELFEAEES